MIRLVALAVVASLFASGCASTGDHRLRFVSGDGPQYPDEARKEHIEGYVVVTYDIDVNGNVANAHVVDAAPPGVFDAAALAAVSAWRFYAPVVNGEPQAVHDHSNRFEFKLGDADQYAR
jgi:TonB family protein